MREGKNVVAVKLKVYNQKSEDEELEAFWVNHLKKEKNIITWKKYA